MMCKICARQIEGQIEGQIAKADTYYLSVFGILLNIQIIVL